MSGTAWLLSYVLLWGAVLVLSFAVVALLRQVGVLHTRIAPMGVHFAGEGPELDQPAPTVDGVGLRRGTVHPVGLHVADLRAVWTPEAGAGPTGPELRRHQAAPDRSRRPTRGVLPVPRSVDPYLVAIDTDGLVRSRGVANSLDQVEEMLAEVLAGPPVADLSSSAVPDHSNQVVQL